MKNTISALGIILSMVGTLLTLWTILSTKSSYAGTAAEFDNHHKEFPKQKAQAIIGFIAILLGGILQIWGLYI